MSSEKNYVDWMLVKAKINNFELRPDYKQRDIWWCSVGENIGYEEDGKNIFFNRPVLILKKFGHGLFWGVPLSTTKKRGKYYYEFEFNGRVSVALLSQLRAFDSARLNNGRASARIGMVSQKVFGDIKQKIHQLMD